MTHAKYIVWLHQITGKALSTLLFISFYLQNGCWRHCGWFSSVFRFLFISASSRHFLLKILALTFYFCMLIFLFFSCCFALRSVSANGLCLLKGLAIYWFWNQLKGSKVTSLANIGSGWVASICATRDCLGIEDEAYAMEDGQSCGWDEVDWVAVDEMHRFLINCTSAPILWFCLELLQSRQSWKKNESKVALTESAQLPFGNFYDHDFYSWVKSEGSEEPVTSLMAMPSAACFGVIFCTVNPNKLNQLTLNVGTVLRQCK